MSGHILSMRLLCRCYFFTECQFLIELWYVQCLLRSRCNTKNFTAKRPCFETASPGSAIFLSVSTTAAYPLRVNARHGTPDLQRRGFLRSQDPRPSPSGTWVQTLSSVSGFLPARLGIQFSPWHEPCQEQLQFSRFFSTGVETSHVFFPFPYSPCEDPMGLYHSMLETLYWLSVWLIVGHYESDYEDSFCG